MKREIAALLIALLLALPLAAVAMEMMEHGTMQMDAAMIMLPMQSSDNINATVHLKDVKAMMAKMGMQPTHHFMVTLEDNNGEELVPQLVAVKIVDPSGKEGAAVELMAMAGHAGADIILPLPGPYKFRVAAKMADGKKAQFEFAYTVK